MAPLTLYCEHCGAANTTEMVECFVCKKSLQFSPTAVAAQYSLSSSPAPSTPATASDHLFPGSMLNQRYEIMSEIGQGGFSVVYVAKDLERKNMKVAIKQIDIGSLNPRQVIEATDTYNREVQLLSRLKHPNLPRIYEHFTDPSHWYVVMDYIEGETLEDYVEKSGKGYLPVKEVLNLGIQLCKVLRFLHRQNPPIIFRDVKPSNIMRTPNGRLYLIDFGIARHFTSGKKKDTSPLGSPGYAAPEQYGTAQTSVQADIYSLGATLQTLLTGQDPLDTSPVSGHPVPRRLRALLDHMLEPDASKRPKSMNEVGLRLNRIKRGIFGAPLDYLRGLFLALPCPFIPLLLIGTYRLMGIFNLGALLFVPFVMLDLGVLIILPFIFVMHLITAIRYLFSAPMRPVGLGMLTVLVFLVVAIYMFWPFLPLLPFAIGD